MAKSILMSKTIKLLCVENTCPNLRHEKKMLLLSRDTKELFGFICHMSELVVLL